MAKLPRSPHPLPELTSTELATYIEDLNKTLGTSLLDTDRELVLAQLGKAYAEQNERAQEGSMPAAPEDHCVTHPHVHPIP